MPERKAGNILVRPKGVRELRQIHLGKYPALRLAKARIKARELQANIAFDPKHRASSNASARHRRSRTSQNNLRPSISSITSCARELSCGRGSRRISSQPSDGLNSTRSASSMISLPYSTRSHSENGAAQADNVLSVLRSIVTFQIGRDEHARNFLPSCGIKRYKPNPRNRVLNDDEIRALWKAASRLGTFGRIVRLSSPNSPI